MDLLSGIWRGSPLERCQCRACIRARGDMDFESGLPAEWTRMIVCAVCGNKRCPHAADHRHPCTGSNDPGQYGSAFDYMGPIDTVEIEQ